MRRDLDGIPWDAAVGIAFLLFLAWILATVPR